MHRSTIVLSFSDERWIAPSVRRTNILTSFNNLIPFLQTRHHRFRHPPSRSIGSAHLHPSTRRTFSYGHPQGLPAQVTHQQGDRSSLLGQGSSRLLRRRFNGNLPTRMQTGHQRKHRHRYSKRKGERAAKPDSGMDGKWARMSCKHKASPSIFKEKGRESSQTRLRDGW